MNERLRPVDRIENPIEAVGAGKRSQLLAHHAVAGKLADDLRANQRLGLAVGRPSPASVSRLVSTCSDFDW